MSRAVIITSYLEHPLDIRSQLRPDDYIVCLDGGLDIAQKQGIAPDLLLGDFDSIDGGFPDDICSADARSSASAADGGRGRQTKICRYPAEKDYTDLELAFRILDPEKTPEILVIGALGGRLDQTLVNVQMLQKYTATPAQWNHDQAPEELPSDGHSGPGGSGGSIDPDPADQPICGEAAVSQSGSRQSSPQSPHQYCDDYGSDRQYRLIEMADGHNRCFVVHGDGSGTCESVPSDGPWVYTFPRQPNSYLSLLPLTEECRGVSLRGVKYPLTDAVLHRGTSLSISNEFVAEEASLCIRRGSLLVVVTRGNARDRI